MGNDQKPKVALCLGGDVGRFFEQFKVLYEQQTPSNLPPRHEVFEGIDQFVEFRSHGWAGSRFFPHTLGPITWTYSKQLVLEEDGETYSIQVGKITHFDNPSARERSFVKLFDDGGQLIATISDSINGGNLIGEQLSGGGINLMQSAFYAVIGERLPTCWWKKI